MICELSRIGRWVIGIIVLTVGAGLAQAGRLTSERGFEAAFGFDGRKPPESLTVTFVHCSAPGSVLWPGEKARFEFELLNKSAQPLHAQGSWQIVQYGTRCGLLDPLSDVRVIKIRDVASVPAAVNLPAAGWTRLTLELPVPEEFGAYAIVLSLDGPGKQLAATCIRAVPVDGGKVHDPAFALDTEKPEVAPLFQRLGIRGTRQEWACFALDDEKSWARLDEFMKRMAESDITVMLTVMSDKKHMPMGCVRGLLNDNNEGKMDYPGDFAALPEFDGEFEKWVAAVARRYGWPHGPLNAVELWNEPWEGISISGWGADMLRYRELYTHMALGVEAARRDSGVQVLIGGTCSSMNTDDKLFPDGNDEPFLKWLDFTSIHYQPMCSQPVLVKRFAQRQSPLGPTRVWDTETWLANSEDRFGGIVASMRAQGLERTAGIQHDYVRNIESPTVHQPDGKTTRLTTVQALAPAVAVAATDQFMGQRRFREILFKNGLPWVFVFDGLPEKGADDGTVIVVGDLGAYYDRNQLLFSGVLGLEARKRSRPLRAALDALPPDAPRKAVNAALADARTGEILDHASMTLDDPQNRFTSHDYYGAPTRSQAGKLLIRLDGTACFLRTDGSPGSFANLLDALRSARIDGYEPAEIVARDLLGRVENKPALRLRITNILNRPITGTLDVKLGLLELGGARRELTLSPHETRELALDVTGGAAVPDNSYALSASFDAGADGRVTHEETLHVNLIARRTITVDGSLDDWKDVLPQPIRSAPGAGKNLTEKAWLPFVKFDEAAGQGFASGYLAYDDQFFYFAARIADSTPDPGNIRFARRDDDSFFYPQVSYALKEDRVTHQWVRGAEKLWPEGVRRYSYRRNPLLPSGDRTDNVQIGFNVLPIEQTDWLAFPPGTMPRFMCYKTTDYEYALNAVAENQGGGTELWRLLAPGMPRKHFFPRQPKSPIDGGPVDGAKLVMTHIGSTRIVESAIPWSELPDVHKRMQAGEPIKFTFRVNDNQGPSYELNANRSVSKIDSYALHDYWATSWAVETEFGFEK